MVCFIIQKKSRTAEVLYLWSQYIGKIYLTEAQPYEQSHLSNGNVNFDKLDELNENIVDRYYNEKNNSQKF